MAYINQKQITIHRDIPEVKKGTNRAFLSVYNDVIETAARNLNGSAFKAYMYLLMNKPGYSLYYSPEHFVKTFGVGLTSAKKVCDELRQAGYLVEVAPFQYEFYEMPQMKQEPIEIVKEKRGFKLPDGTIHYFTYKELLEINEGEVAETNADWATGIKEG